MHNNTLERTIRNAGNDIRDRVTDIAFQLRTDVMDAKEAISSTVNRERRIAADNVRRMGRKATRYCRRHPVQSLATALAVGFLIGSYPRLARTFRRHS